jgi:hypothetical protein
VEAGFDVVTLQRLVQVLERAKSKGIGEFQDQDA